MLDDNSAPISKWAKAGLYATYYQSLGMLLKTDLGPEPFS